MMNYNFILLAVAAIFISCNYGDQNINGTESEPSSKTATTMEQSFYDFEVKDINGEPFSMADLKGKKVMIVNTASECGLTPQYEQLQELYDSLGGDDFVIVGFPANNFGGQEPGSEDEIAAFCEKNYGVSFPMMSKISVKGDDCHPLYQWLIEQEIERSGNEEFEVLWNFHKFLIDEDGNYVKQLHPRTLPIDEEIVNWIQGS